MTPYEKAHQQFFGKNVLIFGLGLLGGALGDTRFFAKLGAHVRVTDAKSEEQLQQTLSTLKDVAFEKTLGQHKAEDIEWADVIVRNPSIPIDHELMKYARELNKRIVMRTSLFVELAGVQTIGITGTRGKTTTTMMIHQLVSTFASKKVYLGGNVAGISDLELLEQITNPDDTVVVLELSSWQLQGFNESKISPHIGVITNLYPDHLNRYHSLDEYYEDKHAIIKYQNSSDHTVLNDMQPELKQWASDSKAKIHWFKDAEVDDVILKIPGQHNRMNAAAALKVASILGFDRSKSVEVLSNFSGVPYRLQVIAAKNGITYINDTTSTTPIATITALEAIDQKPILILGGSDKKLPVEDMITKINTKAKQIILLPGDGTDRIESKLDKNLIISKVSSMDEAVTVASNIASPDDVILLSPGFTSFGLFNNEFHRGDEFNRCVQNLP